VISTQVNANGANAVSAPIATGDAAEPRRSAKDHNGLYVAGEVRILVLDDDQAVCRVIQAALANNDFTVDAVSDPDQMEAALRKQTYNIIILDYVIPGLQSEQVLEWVRESQPDASIIVVTAYPSIDSALNCLRARTHDYLTKPFQIAHLQRIVMRCLESTRHGDPRAP
jgi:DNA-binding NtrC family response regulator